MSDGSSIEWCDATWTIAVGCTRVSAGCDHCYAATFVHRGMHETHLGLTKLRPKSAKRPGVDWNGEVRLLPERLADPLKWRKPRRVFVGSITDLFHPSIPFEYIAAVFGVMAACQQHTFLVLTKRIERAREFFAWLTDASSGWGHSSAQHALLIATRKAAEEFGAGRDIEKLASSPCPPWPLPNVQLGTSVEDQDTADARIPELLQCPAAVHWVSAEPLLGPIALAKPMTAGSTTWSCAMYHLGWVVVGGESGAGARPFHVEWARSLIQQARGLPTKVFVKQLGGNVRDRNDATFAWSSDDGDESAWPASITPEHVEDNPNGFREEYQGAPVRVRLRDRKGKEMAEWPADLRVREVA